MLKFPNKIREDNNNIRVAIGKWPIFLKHLTNVQNNLNNKSNFSYFMVLIIPLLMHFDLQTSIALK